MKELIEIQNRLNAPKSRRNNFGNYNYRSAEDILKAAKPLLKEQGCVLLLSDEVKEVGSTYTYNTKNSKNGQSSESAYNGTRIYVIATATIINSNGEKVSVQGMAREEVAKAGMDAAQITGAASSYARKYALNGLFAIDDGVDADSLHGAQSVVQQQQTAQQTQDGMTAQEYIRVYVAPEIEQAQSSTDLTAVFNRYPNLQAVPEFMTELSKRRKALGIRKSNE